MDATLDDDRAAVLSATTVRGEHIAKLKLEQDTITELKQAHTLLTVALGFEQASVGRLNQIHTEAIARAHAATDAYNTYGTALNEAGGGTLEQQNLLSALKEVMDKANQAVRDSNAAITQNNANIRDNTNLLRDNAKAQATVANERAAALRSYDAFMTAQKQQYREDVDTFEMTNQQKFAYYQQMLANMGATTVDNEKQKEQVFSKELAAYQGMMQDQYKATTSFLDDILVAHVSFKDEIKKIYDEMLKNYINNFAKMILNPNAAASQGASGGGAVGGLAGLFGAAQGGNGKSGIDSLFSNGGQTKPLDVNIAQQGGSAVAKVGDVVGGIKVIGHVQAKPADTSAIDKQAADMAKITNTLQKVASAIASAAIIQQGFSQGGISGGIQAGMGAASLLTTLAPHFGPWGMAVAGAVGLGAALMHHDNPNLMPDKYNTATYGQAIANLQGSGLMGNSTMNANGQQFTSTDSSTTGGIGDMGFIANYIKQSGGKGLTDAEIKEFANMPQVGGITGGKDGNLTLANGQTVNWQTLAADAADAVSKITSSIGDGAIAIYKVTRDLPNFNTGSVSGWGSSINGVGTQTATSGPTSGATRHTQPIVVNVHNPVMMGTTVAEVANTIKVQIAKNTSQNYRNQNVY